MTKIDVTINRDKYIGGSDIPVIMGLSTFKTRYQLLLEKANLSESSFLGNKYTNYGNVLEPKIRDYINNKYETDYEPSQIINGAFRSNCDGLDALSVLEIKTTSHIYNTVDEYKTYLVQLLFYMCEFSRELGILAVYERPEDFNDEFDVNRLQEFNVYKSDYEYLIDEIYYEIERFLDDLAKLKENPLLSEQDFISSDIVQLSNKVVALEVKMAEFKEFEKNYKAMKTELFEAMMSADIKSWETPRGIKITRVDETPSKTVMVKEFDVDAFSQDHPDMYDEYIKEVEKEQKGRSGFVKITLPKEQK